MIELGIQERSAISALQWLPVEGIRTQYAEYLQDCEVFVVNGSLAEYEGKKYKSITAVADKLITLPLWAEQQALLGCFLKYDI